MLIPGRGSLICPSAAGVVVVAIVMVQSSLMTHPPMDVSLTPIGIWKGPRALLKETYAVATRGALNFWRGRAREFRSFAEAVPTSVEADVFA